MKIVTIVINGTPTPFITKQSFENLSETIENIGYAVEAKHLKNEFRIFKKNKNISNSNDKIKDKMIESILIESEFLELMESKWGRKHNVKLKFVLNKHIADFNVKEEVKY